MTFSSSLDYLARRKARTLQFGKLTWVGLMIVALGWTLLLSGISLADIVNRLSGHVSPAAVSINMSVVAQCTILTGFGLSILGLLQTGFSALNRFFDSVLERTSKRQERPDFDQSLARAEMSPRTNAALQNYKQAPAVSAKVSPRKVVERGLLKDRAYVRFGDGTIEVETLLGLRRFASLREAAEFIG